MVVGVPNSHVQAKHVRIQKHARPRYFVVHSTAKLYTKEQIHAYKKHNVVWKAHKYVMKDGTIVEVWPFSDRRVWATKREKHQHSLVGAMLHVELNYEHGGEPTEEQYESLAGLYAEAVKSYGKLTLVPHKEVDRGILGGHSDPENFDFDHFCDILKRNGIALGPEERISQTRYEIPNQADQKDSWPPQLSGPPQHKLTRARMR